jgi:hypothetical protein
LIGGLRRVSSSHSLLSASDQFGIFWISSSASTTPALSASPAPRRAASPRRLPLLRDPLGAAQGRLIGAGIAKPATDVLGKLLHQSGLADLPRAGHNLDKVAWLGQPMAQLRSLGPLAGF